MVATPGNPTLGDHAPAEGSPRERFIERSEAWIRRLAEELPDDVLASALDATGAPPDLSSATLSGADLSAALSAADTDASHRALLLRTVREVTRIVNDLPGDLLVSALAAPSDYGALARALSDPRVADPSRQVDPLAGAVGRSIAHRKRLSQLAGEMLTSAQVADLLGIKRQAIDKRRKAGKLLGIRMGSDWCYPAFQFTDDDVLEGLPAVLAAFEGAEPWVIIDSLLAPDEALGGCSPLDALRAGDRAKVTRWLNQMGGDGFT